jgi:hypothetical protein
VLKHFVRKGAAKTDKRQLQQWNILGGKFFTKHQALLDFKFPELDSTKMVTWKCHVDDSTSANKAAYDMIIGMDLMVSIDIFINTATKTIDWKELSIPLKEKGDLREAFLVQEAYDYATATEVLKTAEDRHKQILDADYSKVNIKQYVEALSHLSSIKKAQLTHTLETYPTLFGGGLGELKLKPVTFQLKENAKPYHARAYPIPHAYKAVTKMKVQCFCDIGVLERNPGSEWAAASFIQPKKTGNVQVLTDF